MRNFEEVQAAVRDVDFGGLTGPEVSLHYPPVPAMVANIPKPTIKRNGSIGPSNRRSNIFARVDLFIRSNVAESSGEQGM